MQSGNAISTDSEEARQRRHKDASSQGCEVTTRLKDQGCRCMVTIYPMATQLLHECLDSALLFDNLPPISPVNRSLREKAQVRL